MELSSHSSHHWEWIVICQRIDLSLNDLKLPLHIFLFLKLIQKIAVTLPIKRVEFYCDYMSDFSFLDMNNFISFSLCHLSSRCLQQYISCVNWFLNVVNSILKDTLWGMWLKITGKGQGCVAIWISDSIFWLFYFTPMLTGRYNALPKKVPKRIIQKKSQQQIRDEDVSFILSFFYWVQQLFHGWGSFSWIHWNGWNLQLKCQNTLIVSYMCLSAFGILGFHKD